jgi:hypothetical protein
MQLHNRLSSLFQKETDRLLKSFLSENPDLLKKYVGGGITAVSTVLAPINSLMRHLLTVQGLDPDAVPGAKDRAEFLKGLEAFFDDKHEKDFDEDYDLSWVQQKFNKTRGTLKDLQLTKDKFMELTDLSRLPNLGRVEDFTEEPIDHIAQKVDQIAPEADKREIRMIDDKPTKFEPGDAIQELREFMTDLSKKLGDVKPVGIKTGKRKLNKGKTVRGPGPRVHRVLNTEPVKEGPSTLKVESDRKERAPTNRPPGRSLHDLASTKKAQAKAAKEATPEFQAELKRKTERATKLTQLMIDKGFCEASDKAREEQIVQMLNWYDSNFDALERVINRYAPTKDAIAENKFKGSFRRTKK